MSFSSDIKNELAQLTNEQPCCELAQCYGMLEFGRAFGANSITLQTENVAVATRYAALLQSVCRVSPDLASPSHPEKGGMYTVTVPSASRKAVLSVFGHDGKEVAVRLNRANLECEQCAAAFLRGAFLSCGAITNPEVDYHLEFSVPYYNLSRDLMTLLSEQNLKAKTVRRKGNYVVYFKESEQIEDCLTLMGAVSASLELMGVKMVKDIRNKINRVSNCESANLDKTVAASVAQVTAIRKIEQQRGLDSLPEDLRELCRLRLDNPDYSLRELGENLPSPISRSGVNHRLQRILAIAEEC